MSYDVIVIGGGPAAMSVPFVPLNSVSRSLVSKDEGLWAVPV